MALYENKYGLSVMELNELCNLYEAHSTAEIIMENYPVREQDAIFIGYEVRERMKDEERCDGEAEMEIIKECIDEYTGSYEIIVKCQGKDNKMYDLRLLWSSNEDDCIGIYLYNEGNDDDDIDGGELTDVGNYELYEKVDDCLELIGFSPKEYWIDIDI